MTDLEQDEAVARNVLKHAVEHIHASPDLAQRVEMRAAARRRTTRWSAAGAAALLVIGTTAGIVTFGNGGGSPGSSPTSVSNAVQVPSCATNSAAYAVTAAPTKPSGPVVAGSLSAALVCRFAGDGHLAGSATVIDRTELSSLQTVMNASKAYSGPMYCMQFSGTAVIVLVYPGGQPAVDVTYDPSCAEVYTKAGTYLAGGGVNQLVTSLTGSWQSTASPTPNAH